MAQRAPGHRSTGLVALDPPVPAQMLPAHRSRHFRDGGLCVSLGFVAAGVAAASGQSVIVIPSLAAGVVGGAVVSSQGARRAARRTLRDRLVEALAQPMSVRTLDRRTVRMKNWAPGWPGLPHVIKLRYGPSAPTTDPAWLPAVLATIEARLTAIYDVQRHDPLRCLLVLQLRTGVTATGEVVFPARVRAERTVLELIGPTARVVDVVMSGDEPSSLTVEHEAGTKLAAAGYRARVERTVSTVLPGRWRARWDLEGDRVTFEIRPSFPTQIWVPPTVVDPDRDVLSSWDQVSIPYGVDEDGTELCWRPAVMPHLMVVGRTGTGKTVFVHTILVAAAALGWPIWVVDGKRVEFLGFRDWPNVQIVASSIWHQVAVIHRAHALMEHRYHLVDTGQASEADFEPLLVFLDEYADFRAAVIQWWAAVKPPGSKLRYPPVLELLASLARKGRTARVHLVFGTQRPDAEYFGGDMRDNFWMVSMGRLSPQAAVMVWQDPAAATTIPRGMRGRATSENDKGRPVEIQTYRTPDPRKAPAEDDEQQQLIAALRPPEARHPRLVILPPPMDADLDSDAPVRLPTYVDYAAAPWGLASEHPEADPMQQRPLTSEDARLLASPAAMLGIAMPGHGSNKPAPSRLEHLMPAQAAAPAEEVIDSDADTPGPGDPGGDWRFEGYGPAVSVPAEDLTVGDLVLVDDASDQWAVVDEEPGDDPTDSDGLAICWRDDSDDQGLLSVPYGTRLSTRHPLDEED